MVERNDIALIIADHRMPGMTGVELLEETLKKHPDIIRIILTAYTDDKLVIEAINMGFVYSCIGKPWEIEEVKAIIREWIETYEIACASRELYTRTLLQSGIISREQLDSALEVQRTEKKKIGEILVERGMVSRSQLKEVLSLQRVGRRKLGDMLVDLGVISSDDVKLALGLQKYERRRLAEIFMNLGYADEDSIVSSYALQLGMPYVSLSQFTRRSELADLLPPKLAYKYTIVPVDRAGRVLVVATSEPLSDKAKSEIEEETGLKVMTVCSSHRDIEAALRQCYQDGYKPKYSDFPLLDKK
jgi:response regulator of citrate/malate metabolism